MPRRRAPASALFSARISRDRNPAVDRVRSEQRRRTLVLVPEDDPHDENPGPDAQALMRLLGTQARAALAELPPVKREAVVLAYWDGYTQSEIARLTQTPLGSVKSRMHGALRDLSAMLVPGTSTRSAALSG